MASSSLAKSIDSTLIRLSGGSVTRTRYAPMEVELVLKIGLRNLKALVLVSTMMGYRCLYELLPCLRNANVSTSSTLETLLLEIQVFMYELNAKEFYTELMVGKATFLPKLVDEELSSKGAYQFSSLLTVDEVAVIADSAADNASACRPLLLGIIFDTGAFEAMDAFEFHMRFMKNVLVFARLAGVELVDVLRFHIQPILINATRVFIVIADDERGGDFERWCKSIEPECLKVNRMATDPRVYQAYSHTLAMAGSSSTPPQMGDEAVQNLLNSLVSLLWDALRHALDSEMKNGFISLYERLKFLRDVVKQRPASLNDAISGQVLVLICDAGVLICSFHQPDGDQLSDLLQRFDVFREQVVASQPHMQADDELGFHDFKTIDTPDGNEMAHQVLGFHGDEVATVLDRLIGGSKHLRIVPICGMAGLGKTTFALKLYNDPQVLHHFWAHAWCPVSQELDKKKVLLQLLDQILPGDYSYMSEDDLANKFRQSLKGRRYLILLDDVWSLEAWNSLKASFPDDSNGSRIILTSRLVDIIAPSQQPDESPYLLRLREESECVKILQAKLLHKEGWSSDLGMEVARKCKGLPLTLVVISGLLATTKQQDWKAILDHLSSGNSVSSAEQCKIALELGYKHLPNYLQPCFLYFGAFPEDEEVSVKMVIRLWMAEEFVIKDELKRIEDVGQEYVEELIHRSLIMVGENTSLGGVKTCQIHDLLHGFCRSKMKQENLLHLFPQTHDQLSESNEMCNLQRLSIQTTAVDFKEAKLFYPDAVSLLFCFREHLMHVFDMSFITHIFKLLKVLHMDSVGLNNGIPDEIGLLTRLSYLSFSSGVPIIPPSVGDLSNLETFIAEIRAHDVIAFPGTFWNLQKLKCLYIKTHGDGFTLPVENLENSPSLLELETLSGVAFYSDDSMVKQLQKFPRIRRLKCRCNGVVIDIPTQVQSLSMRAHDFVRFEFGSTAENLRKLSLSKFELSMEEIGMIGKLPNLEVLKLDWIKFPDGTLEMEEEEFQKLRYLKLVCCRGLERWTASDDELPSLQKLKFVSCEELEEIPPWLEDISTLEEIQVVYCSSALESIVRNIEETQKDYGKLIKLRIRWKDYIRL